MNHVIPDCADAGATSTRKHSAALTAPLPDTDDPAKLIGELFRRLAMASETFSPQGFTRIMSAIHVALGRAVLSEAERQAERLRQRAGPPGSITRVSSTATRRVDFDGGFDIDDRG